MLLFYSLLFSSCKKDSDLFSESQQPSVQNSAIARKSAISESDVLIWLNSQMGAQATSFRNDFIEKVKLNLLGANLYSEPLDDENLIIVPLLNDYFSQHIPLGEQPLQYLLLVEDSLGAIRRGDLVLFFPNDPSVQSLPSGAFNSFFRSDTFPVDGRFTVLFLDDLFQFEMEFSENHPIKFKACEGRYPLPTEPSGIPFCIDWYLVTTIYFTDGHTEVTETYLYSTCSDQGGGGGGSGGTNTGTNGPVYMPPLQGPEQVIKPVSFVVMNKHDSPNDMWLMKAHYVLSGMRFPQNSSNLNYFCSIIPDDPDKTITYYQNQQLNPTYEYYVQSGTVSNQYNLTGSQNQNAWAYFVGSMTYPKKPDYGTKIYAKRQDFQASIQLY